MADYLSKADWRKHLNLKEHKNVKKTGVSDLIDAIEKAKKANDSVKQIEAYDALVKKAEELKKDKKYKDIGTLTSYLDSMIRDAKAAKNKVQVGEDKEANPAKKVDSPLVGQLMRLKQLDREGAWKFIAAPGKPSSGLVLSKRDITAQDRKTALALRGKAGPFFSGLCYTEKGRYVFELEEMPPKGLAKGIKFAAKLHAEMNIKVMVRGAGIDVTDEDDADFDEVGTEGEQGPAASKVDYPSREVWTQRLQKLANVKPELRGEASSGILGQVKLLEGRLVADETLGPEEKIEQQKLLDSVRQKADLIGRGKVGAEALGGGQKPPAKPAPYDSFDVWKGRIEKIQQLDPQKREQGLHLLSEKLKQVQQQAAQDKLLSPEDRQRELDCVAEALRLIGHKGEAKERKAQEQSDQYQYMTDNLEFVDRAAFPKGGAKAIARRKEELQADKGLTKVVMAMAEFENDKSPKAQAKLTKECESYLKEIAKQKELASGDEKALAVIGEREKIAKQALQQTRLMELSAEYKAFGPPPWDEETSEKVSELQMAFLFEEAAVKRGPDGAPMGLSPLGGEGGVNESFWVKRAETGYGKHEGKGERLYIFKPGETEDGGIYGMPKGHGAPREVLAKSMNDQLAEYGFDIGVCPTTMTRVDTAKLGGREEYGGEEDGGRTLGAMQALASNKGEFKTLKDSGADLGKKIDSRNFGEIAVFDMIYFNMDRHSGNLLLGEEDPETGKVPLIPIDHGLGLPNKETLYMNSGRLLETQNTLMGADIPQKKELLHKDVQANLKAMNPTDLVEGMRKSRDDLARRHPETAGTVTDEALAMMERRIAFLQFACDKLTVKQLNEANAIHAYDIQEARTPKDFQKIVDQVLRESGPREEGRKVFALWTQASEAKDKKNYLKPIQDLGWCLEVAGQELEFWLDKNADLAAKIIKGRIPNPGAKKEISDRADMIGQPELLDEIKGETIRSQLEIVRSKAPYDWEKHVPYGSKDDALLPQYKVLGGDGELEKAVKQFAIQGDPDKLANKVQHLVYWKGLKDQGGLEAYFKLGGEHQDKIEFVVRRLAELKREVASRKAVLAIDDDQLSKRQVKHLSELTGQAETLIKKVRNKNQKQEFQKNLDGLKDLVKKGQADEAQAKLMYFGPKVAHRIDSEETQHKVLNDMVLKIEGRLSKIDRTILGEFRGEFEKRLQGAKDKIEGAEFDGLRKELTELTARLDIAELGDQSDYRKTEAEIVELGNFGAATLQGESLSKWQKSLTAAESSLKTFEMADVPGHLSALRSLKKLAARLPDLKEKAAALKGREQHGELAKAILGIEKSIAAFDTANTGNGIDYADKLIKGMTDEKVQKVA